MTAPLAQTSADRYFAIRTDNTWVNAILGVSGMHPAAALGPVALASVQYYDLRGQRFDPEFNPPGTLVALTKAAEDPDPIAVRDRLIAVLRHLSDTVEQRIAARPVPRPTPDEARATLPVLDGWPLEDCFTLLYPTFGHNVGITPANPGSWWHMFWCH